MIIRIKGDKEMAAMNYALEYIMMTNEEDKKELLMEVSKMEEEMKEEMKEEEKRVIMEVKKVASEDYRAAVCYKIARSWRTKEMIYNEVRMSGIMEEVVRMVYVIKSRTMEMSRLVPYDRGVLAIYLTEMTEVMNVLNRMIMNGKYKKYGMTMERLKMIKVNMMELIRHF